MMQGGGRRTEVDKEQPGVGVYSTMGLCSVEDVWGEGDAIRDMWGGVVAPAPRASTEKACARAAHRPTGESSFQFSLVIWGALRMPVILGEGRERDDRAGRERIGMERRGMGEREK